MLMTHSWPPAGLIPILPKCLSADGVHQYDIYQRRRKPTGGGLGGARRHHESLQHNRADFITYSQAHDDLFPQSLPPNGVIVGGYSFQVPATATDRSNLSNPDRPASATSDGIGAPGLSCSSRADQWFVDQGAINALKNVTIGSREISGRQLYPFRWFNAGDFGNTNLQNADVEQVFQSAIYSLNYPPAGSDFFDAMDSCGDTGSLDQNPADANFGCYTNAAVYPYPFTYTLNNYTYTYDINTNLISTVIDPFSITYPIYIDTTSVTAYSTKTYIYPTSTNVIQVANTHYFPPNPYVPNLFDGNDTNINQIAFGDGVLDVCDVYVTYRRSLDTNSLVWFQRFWTNGVRVAVASNAPAIQSSAAKSSGGKVSASSQPR